MPHTPDHTVPPTQQVPGVELPAGVVPNPQSGTSQDTLNLAKQQVVNPALPQGAVITPALQQTQTNEMLSTPGVSTTVPTAVVPTATAGTATATTPQTATQVATPAQQAAA